MDFHRWFLAGVVSLWVVWGGGVWAGARQAAWADERVPTTQGGTAAAVEQAVPNLEMRQLEQRVRSLKEESWRIKARIDMLKEAMLAGGMGAQGSIVHENRMGGLFKLVKLTYTLDGIQIYSKSDEGGLNGQRHIDVLKGPLDPGKHVLAAVMVYQGAGYGIFSYMKGYSFTVKAIHPFVAVEGKETQVTVYGYEKGGPLTPVQSRPAVEFKVNTAVAVAGS